VENTFVFQFAQATVVAVFAIFISDFKKKTGMVPLINEKWTHALKLSLLAPTLVYAYSLATPSWISQVGLASLGLTMLGTAIVVKAKSDLSRHYTWTGFCMETPKLVANGIYAYIRHPLYAGIYIFVSGITLTIIAHTTWHLFVPAVMALVYVMSFLAVSAARETKTLEKKLGKEFLAYKEKVHFCLPLRRYVEQEKT
jgi:protein-S-isoprenylcysteine O-methyltransferase Ste14